MRYVLVGRGRQCSWHTDRTSRLRLNAAYEERIVEKEAVSDGQNECRDNVEPADSLHLVSQE